MSHLYDSADSIVRALRPSEPIFCVRPHILRETAKRLIAAFPGDVLYAVKCNEHPLVLQALYEGGVRHFDTASIAEIRGIREAMDGATCHYMHPIKTPEAIAEAYHEHGVRSFVLDHEDELTKIMLATGNARDVTLLVRLAMPHNQAVLCLSGKFGAPVEDAVKLLKAIKVTGNKNGLTFHVGSQCLSTKAFEKAIEVVGETIAQAGFPIDILDVGGGFPGLYNGDEPDFESFVETIVASCRRIGLASTTNLQCEPGRALVADGMSVLVRTELRRGKALYVNDGTYGGLAELRFLGACFPMRVIRIDGEASGERMGFDLFGPTCDSVDSMPGPHWLPSDIRAGDWIEITRMGAYSNALRTQFNGFRSDNFLIVCDDGLADRKVATQSEEDGVVVKLRSVG